MMYYYNDFYPMNYFGHGYFGFGSLFMIIFWGVVIYMLVKIAMNAKGDHKNAIDILKERYAKGEINKEQFESMKKDLH